MIYRNLSEFVQYTVYSNACWVVWCILLHYHFGSIIARITTMFNNFSQTFLAILLIILISDLTGGSKCNWSLNVETSNSFFCLTFSVHPEQPGQRGGGPVGPARVRRRLRRGGARGQHGGEESYHSYFYFARIARYTGDPVSWTFCDYLYWINSYVEMCTKGSMPIFVRFPKLPI